MDYEILKVIWWLLLGVLLIGYAIMDGFDLGVATLLPFVAKNDTERRMMINSIGPFWEGNQVWLILGGGAIFAAWPYVYAISFSSFYLALFLILIALILRPVAFKFRSKRSSFTWRNTWDWMHFISGVLPALIAGVAVGNVILGVPFTFDKNSLQPLYTGNFLGLLNPFALLIGLISLTMLIRHGALYAALRVDEPIASRSIKIAIVANYLMVIFFILASIWVVNINGYIITSNIDTNGYANPLNKTVSIVKGAWFTNFMNHKWMFIAPILAIVFSFISIWVAKKGSFGKAFTCSSISILGVVSTSGLGMFPFILPSITNPNASLTVWDASASFFTLKIMLIVTLIIMPIVLAYTIWVYIKLRGKIIATMFKSSFNQKIDSGY